MFWAVTLPSELVGPSTITFSPVLRSDFWAWSALLIAVDSESMTILVLPS